MGGAWRLRGYVVEGLLGQGGSGEVWRARVAATGEKVALKRLPVRDDAQVRRATAEAAKLTVLEHPHLVRLHALVPDDTDVVLVLDLAEGGSLAELLAARGRLTPGEVITAIAPVAAALAHVHAAGVVHGDVTPANILFTAGGNALLADLGVARLTGEEDDAESTPAYVDPGVADGGIPSELSDVFMLAATALHALTGEVPWAGSDVDETLALARTGDLGPLPGRLAEAGVPEAMATVLCRALDRSPGRRGTAAAFALDLRHSGVPVAVELDAGRARREPALREVVPPAPTETRPRQGGRHAAPPPPHSSPRGSRSAASVPRSAVGRSSVPPVRVPPAARADTPTWSAALFPARAEQREQPGLPGQPAEFDRPAFVRPSAPAATSVPPIRRASTGRAAAAAAEPSGAEPTSTEQAAAPPPTSRVHPRPRPQIPRPRRAGRGAGSRRPRATTVGAVLVVALVLGAAVLLWSRHLDTSAGARPPVRTSAAPTTHAATPVPSSHAASTPVPTGWPARLATLDARRARAFAERRPDLLAAVYTSATLLRADTSLLLRIVPVGCGLHGVRTTYADVRVAAAGARTVVTAEVSLPATDLICGTTPSGRAPAVGPLRLRTILQGPPATARIVDQQRV